MSIFFVVKRRDKRRMLLSFEGELGFKEDQEERSTTKENVNHFQEEDDAITLGGYRMLICNVKFFNLHQETLDELCHFSSQKIRERQ